jgi:uncharacterized membrane-anchored protein YhcB (DUF1043 family)
MRLPQAAWTVESSVMDEMEDRFLGSEPEGSNMGLLWLAIGLGAIALVLGLIGVWLGVRSGKTAQLVQEEFAAKPDRVPELQAELDSLNNRLEKLGSEFVKLGRTDRQLQENTQKAFDAVIADIRENREGLNTLSERMETLAENMTKPVASRQAAPSRSEDAASDAASDDSEDEATVVEGFHIVSSGETMSAIAKLYGISLGQLMQANPSVNPRALQIGQRLRLP